MAKAVIVSGLLTYDSGKTWFVVGFAKSLKRHGYKVNVFKPVAGHSIWSQYKAFLYSFEKGFLVGEDVMKYIMFLNIDNPVIANPIDVMLSPPDPEQYILNKSIIGYLEDLGNQFKQMILARYTYCSSEKYIHYVFRENVKRIPMDLQQIVNSFVEKVKAEEVSVEDFIKLLRSEDTAKNLDICYSRIARDSDVVLIESFNDALTPYLTLLDIAESIVVVMPTAIAIYLNVSNVKRVVEENMRRFGESGLRTQYLLSSLLPDKVMHLKVRRCEDEEDEVFNELTKLIL